MFLISASPQQGPVRDPPKGEAASPARTWSAGSPVSGSVVDRKELGLPLGMTKSPRAEVFLEGGSAVSLGSGSPLAPILPCLSLCHHHVLPVLATLWATHTHPLTVQRTHRNIPGSTQENPAHILNKCHVFFFFLLKISHYGSKKKLDSSEAEHWP